jgi:uncharacterized RDD family membrane protein YckC
MRCPKCHYISFGSVTRCRNCGYEFSFSPEPQPVDLPIQSADPPIGPLRELTLGEAAHPPAKAAVSASSGPSADADRASAAARFDLPLFTDRSAPDDAPLIAAASAPRQPLAVRRAPPPPPKARFEMSAAAPMLEDDLETDDEARSHADDESELRERERKLRELRASLQSRARSASPDDWVVAPTVLRLAAGLIDVVLILSIDAGVVVATLRVLGLGTADVALLPPVPFVMFLLLLNGGYLATFTAAGGQTIGKMIAGIRVVAQRPADDQGFDRYTPRVSLGSAVLRAAAYLVSLLPAGLGFAAILLDQDRRALHDRLAETRVVRA